MRKTPQSKFEKFFEGLRIIGQFQPAAQLNIVDGDLLISPAKDEHMTRAMKDHIKAFGFVENTEVDAFVYKVNE